MLMESPEKKKPFLVSTNIIVDKISLYLRINCLIFIICV